MGFRSPGFIVFGVRRGQKADQVIRRVRVRDGDSDPSADCPGLSNARRDGVRADLQLGHRCASRARRPRDNGSTLAIRVGIEAGSFGGNGNVAVCWPIYSVCHRGLY